MESRCGVKSPGREGRRVREDAGVTGWLSGNSVALDTQRPEVRTPPGAHTKKRGFFLS